MTKARTIAIVGNGSVPEGAAARIDAADLVVRFNDCRTVGPAGRRTDIVAVCNTGRPALAMLAGGAWKGSEPVRMASEFWGVRDPATFAAMRGPLGERHPELDDFCDDYSQGFATFAATTKRSFRLVPGSVHTALDMQLAAFAPAPYVVPSSGLVVVADVLEGLAGAGDSVLLAGFGHQGWQWHPLAAERRWVDGLVAAGRLARLDNELIDTSSSQGA
ncbi:Urease operon accessory protein [Rhizobium sp. TRM95111]|uniref:Urease operon accessory protein n=1 Tax=Rhizobium alarense TaxID=2846851 RepID=UPI001F289E16|nr:Urease operon accessory protein [Rhizobium alarense]MCF3640914.1 Urease operon accessory protein [Rhizobium alarense]